MATNFDVKAMARQVVVTFLRDPAVQEAWNDNREVFLENLKQYRVLFIPVSQMSLDMDTRAKARQGYAKPFAHLGSPAMLV